MIATLTPNPAVDQTAWVRRIEPGAVNRVVETHLDPAGKGINVSRMAHRLGWPTIAFGFLAGETGNIVEQALRDEGVQHHFVRVPGHTRVNMTLVEECGTATNFYGPGPAVPADQRSALDEILRFWLQPGSVLVLAGSLPAGLPPATYAEYVQAARARGVKVVLDADGEALALGLASRPDLIKPNAAEAERLLGRPVRGAGDAVEAGRELQRAHGIATVVISLGSEGAVCVHGDGAYRVAAPRIVRRSTVGSGDAMVAGMAVAMARGEDVVEGLRLGTAAGAATAMTAGTSLGTAADVAALLPRIEVERLA